MIAEEIKKILEENPDLQEARAVVFLEDKFNPEAVIKKYLSTRLRVMIAESGHHRTPGTGANTTGEHTIEIIVFENPLLRSATVEEPTLSTVANAIKEALHWQKIGSAMLVYRSMRRDDAAANEYRMQISFAAYDIPEGALVEWQGIEGYATSVQVQREGVNVFEANSRGNDAWYGTRNHHMSVRLGVLANITADELPLIGETFAFQGKTWITEEARLTGDDAAPVTLSGRTV